MSSKSRRNKDNTSSGQGSLGMGGQPDDRARDNESGGGDVTNDDIGGGTGPIGGAAGSTHGGAAGRAPGAAGVVGPPGDTGLTRGTTESGAGGS